MRFQSATLLCDLRLRLRCSLNHFYFWRFIFYFFHSVSSRFDSDFLSDAPIWERGEDVFFANLFTFYIKLLCKVWTQKRVFSSKKFFLDPTAKLDSEIGRVNGPFV